MKTYHDNTTKRWDLTDSQRRFIQWLIGHIGADNEVPSWASEDTLTKALSNTLDSGNYTNKGKRILNRLGQYYREDYKLHLEYENTDDEDVDTDGNGLPIDIEALRAVYDSANSGYGRDERIQAFLDKYVPERYKYGR